MRCKILGRPKLRLTGASCEIDSILVSSLTKVYGINIGPPVTLLGTVRDANNMNGLLAGSKQVKYSKLCFAKVVKKLRSRTCSI